LSAQEKEVNFDLLLNEKRNVASNFKILIAENAEWNSA
jgi:hypothetical protein